MMVSLLVAHEHVADGDEDGQQRQECYFQMGGHCLLVGLPFTMQLDRTLFRMPVTVLPVPSVVIVFGFVGVDFRVSIRVFAAAHWVSILNNNLTSLFESFDIKNTEEPSCKELFI